MNYFRKVKLGDEVYSLVYGKGEVIYALPEESRMDGFYMMKVQFKANQVMYTESGYPDWGTDKAQTLFYIRDINLDNMDIETECVPLSKKQINKFRDKDNLEMRCPSGIWRNILDCPTKLVSKALKNMNYHMFRRSRRNNQI